MARRGDVLREHILGTAKGVFLEMGFERTSMDLVASRADTSKRSLYAHFESKERLFLAVIEFVRGLFLDKLRMPGDYSQEPSQALVLFCGRYLEILLYEGSIQMCRVSMAEVARFPQGAAQYFDLIYTEVERRLGSYLKSTFKLPTRGASEMAQDLLGRILVPRFPRALFGVDLLAKSLGPSLSPDFDLLPIRRAVATLTEALRVPRVD